MLFIYSYYLITFSGSYKACFYETLYTSALQLILGKVPDLKIANMIANSSSYLLCARY